MAKTFWISAVVVTVIAAFLGLAAAQLLHSFGHDWAISIVDLTAIYGSQSIDVDPAILASWGEASLEMLAKMVGSGAAIAWAGSLLWVGLAHRTEIDRPGQAVRSFVRWLLLGLLTMALSAAATYGLNSLVPIKSDAIITCVICALIGSAVTYWLATLLATPVRLRPAVPCAPLLP